jgi:uncharacterized protein (DUF433 family)
MSRAAASRTYTAREASVLVELEEKAVRKEMEHRVLETKEPARLTFPALVYLRLLRELNEARLVPTVERRTELFRAIEKALSRRSQVKPLNLSHHLNVELQELVTELRSAIDRFDAWKTRLESDPDVLGGEIVFPNSRLSVRHVGGMLERGEARDAIREDYPYLTELDLDFAGLYVRAYPPRGRPREVPAR